MLSVVEIARFAHNVNRIYCEVLGDYSQTNWKAAPQWQRDSAIDGVTAIQNGMVTAPEQSHENWLAEKKATGWKYGPVKDPDLKEHPCMVPYADLPANQRVKDALFFSVVTILLAG